MLISRLVHEPGTSLGKYGECSFLDENDADAPLLSNPPSLLSHKPCEFAPQGASTSVHHHAVHSALMLTAHSCYAMHCCHMDIMLLLQFAVSS
jgi:hypothetical protein